MINYLPFPLMQSINEPADISKYMIIRFISANNPKKCYFLGIWLPPNGSYSEENDVDAKKVFENKWHSL